MNRGSNLTLGDTGRAEDRVVRILNLHYEAGINDIRKFFGKDFLVVDFIRGINAKTNRNTIGYVLFATEQERINAQALPARKLFGRWVNIIPAVKGFRISPSGDKFRSSDEEEDGIESAPYEETPLAVENMDDFPSLGTKGTGTRNNNLILPTVSTTSSGDQLQADQSTEDEHPKTRAQRHAETEALREAQEKRQGMKAIETWGLLPAELRECYLSVQETLQPMPSGHDGHGQIVTGPPMTLPSQSSRVDDSASPVLRGPPPGIDTSLRPGKHPWNLSGNDDPVHNVIPENAWYSVVQLREQTEKSVPESAHDATTK